MPFGEQITPDGTYRTANLYSTADNIRQKFTGYQKDEETNLDFAEARMYENRHGRFTAVDPLLPSGKSANPQTYNRYVYTSNNPITRVDTNGKEWYYSWSKIDGRFYAIPRWCSGFGCTGPRWTSEVRSTIGQITTVWKGSYVFHNDYSGGYTALDPAENRMLVFNTASEAQTQVNQWRRQAIANFVGGFANGASFAVSLSGADGIIAERGTEMYAAGQRAGVAGSVVSAFTGIGLANALVNRFGSAGLSIFKSLRVTEGVLSEFTHAGKFGFGSYESLRSGVLSTFGKGSGLQAHHLI
jgi:RHS repeat-associated protein